MSHVKNTKFQILIPLFLIVVILAGCNDKNTEDETVTLILGTLDRYSESRLMVEKFNEVNPKVQIEIQVYEKEIIPFDQGYTELQIEIAAGRGPDIIDFGRAYDNSMGASGITEDLYLYMQNDDKFQQQDYFMNILSALAIGEKLPVIIPAFAIRSFGGRTKLLDGMTSWTLEEIIDFYDSKPEGTILYMGDSKREVFGMLLGRNMERFIDWKNGTCHFDGKAFQNLLEFSNRFPEIPWYYTQEFSVVKEYEEGNALVFPLYINNVFETALTRELFLQDDVTYIGYPTEDGMGHIILPGNIVLGINSGSQYKQEAWDFISMFLEEEYQDAILSGLPLRKASLDKLLADAMIVEYEDGKEIIKGSRTFESEEPITVSSISERDKEQLLEIIHNASGIESNNIALGEIISEEAAFYFDGSKTVEEVCKIIQGRVAIYIGERMKPH